ncbi:MAG: hypothetical protein R3B84_16385 [Zavarzinella sp.]
MARPLSVIRKVDWKLHLYHEEWVLDGGYEKHTTNNSLELFHLGDDMREHHNLAADKPEIRDELLLTW